MKLKTKAFVYAEFDKYSKSVRYAVWPNASMSYAGNVIAETEIEFDEPEFNDVINATVKVMKAEQVRIRAEAEAKVNNIEGQIQELLCLEDLSEVAK